MEHASSEQLQPSLRIISFCLLAGLLVYPFSIAASNFLFGAALLLSIFKSEIIKHGFKVCWNEYRTITIGIILFIAFTFIGSLWGSNMSTASHKMGKQLNWFIIPVIIGTVYFLPHLRKKIFIYLSTGLFLHLIVCTMQDLGLITIIGLGSRMEDAAGFIGHLDLGFIYGIWVGALIIVAQKAPKKWAYICYALALYAIITVFLAQGRSGYLTTIAMILLVTGKVLFPGRLKLKLIILTSFLAATTLFFSLHTPSQSKVTRTVSGVKAFLDGDWSNVDLRIKIWATSIEIWKVNPWFGVGTGDYQQAYAKLLQEEEFAHLRIGDHEHAHAHNEFIFELVRWGPLGLLATLYLCWSWLKTGWKKNWQEDTMNAYLCTASGLSIILHGLSEVSLNTQLAPVFAMLILAFSMTKKQANEP